MRISFQPEQLTASSVMSTSESTGGQRTRMSAAAPKTISHFGLLVLFCTILQQVQAQQAGVYDFGQGRYGEKRGNFTPSEVLAIILLIMTIVAGLALTIGLCYYVTKRNSRGMTKVEQNDY